MPMTKGSITLTRLQAFGPTPDAEAAIEELRQEPFHPFEDGVEEERAGICDMVNHLKGSPTLEENYTQVNGGLFFGVRIDTRRVPASELDAHLDMKLEALMKEKDLAFIGKEARVSLKDEVKWDLLKKQRPVAKVTQIAWAYRKGLVNVAGGGSKPLGVLRSVFNRRFGIELRTLTPVNLASMLLAGKGEAEILKGSGREIVEPLMGRLFLAWLWRQASEVGGVGNDEDETSLLIGDAVKLVGDEGKVQEVALKKGEPTESRAGLDAMAEGMLPSSMKIRLLSGDMEWTCTLSESLQISGLKLPKTAGKQDAVNRLADRTYLMEEFIGHLDARYKTFLETVWLSEDEDCDQLCEKTREWAKELAPAEA